MTKQDFVDRFARVAKPRFIELLRLKVPHVYDSTPGHPNSTSLVQNAQIGLKLTRTLQPYSPIERFVEEDLKRGTLEPVLQDWLQPFSGPFLYYPSRRHMPAPLRAFVDFIKRRKAGDVASAALSG